MPKNVEILNFEQLLKHILRVFPSLGGLDHSGSQPMFILIIMEVFLREIHNISAEAGPSSGVFIKACIHGVLISQRSKLWLA